MPSILIIDDDVDTLQMLQILFERSNFVVTTTPDAQTGVDFVRQQTFDIAIIDFSLPGEVTRLETITNVRQIAQHMPIVVLTAVASSENQKKAEAAGCDCFLAKPFRPQHLLNIVDDLIRA